MGKQNFPGFHLRCHCRLVFGRSPVGNCEYLAAIFLLSLAVFVRCWGWWEKGLFLVVWEMFLVGVGLVNWLGKVGGILEQNF